MNQGPICHFLSTCSLLLEAFLGCSLAAGGCLHTPTAALMYHFCHGNSVPCARHRAHLWMSAE